MAATATWVSKVVKHDTVRSVLDFSTTISPHSSCCRLLKPVFCDMAAAYQHPHTPHAPKAASNTHAHPPEPYNPLCRNPGPQAAERGAVVVAGEWARAGSADHRAGARPETLLTLT